MEKNLFSLLEKIRAIGLEGNHYAENAYDKERYASLLEILAEGYAEVLKMPKKEIVELYKKEVGCITPKVGVDIMVPNEKGEILILKRSSKQKNWCLPGGWVDLGESPFEAARREAKEEAGVTIEALKFITITNKGPDIYEGFPYQVNILIGAKPVSNEIAIVLSHEHTAYRWISEQDKDIDWHSGHERYFPKAFEYLKNGSKEVWPEEL